MLVRRILPCQRRAFNLWEFVPVEHQMLQRLYGMKHKNTWKALFEPPKYLLSYPRTVGSMSRGILFR